MSPLHVSQTPWEMAHQSQRGGRAHEMAADTTNDENTQVAAWLAEPKCIYRGGRILTGEKGRVTFAILGDVEPKPESDFGFFQVAVDTINELKDEMGIRFTASVGDLAHTGKIEQYEKITDILSGLTTPFYAIMGNEELVAGEAVFFRYASRWNDDPATIPAGCYVVREGGYRFVFATAHSGGVTFDAEETAWIDDQLRQCAPHPTVLVTHAPAPDVFAAAGNRSMQDPTFSRLLELPHVVMHLSGHTHFDLDAVEHYVQDAHGVHHVHVPGIQRTKVGPRHTPRFRVVELRERGDSAVYTYNLKADRLEPQHTLRFSLT